MSAQELSSRSVPPHLTFAIINSMSHAYVGHVLHKALFKFASRRGRSGETWRGWAENSAGAVGVTISQHGVRRQALPCIAFIIAT